MGAPTTIAALEFGALDVPLHEPFGIAGGAQVVARNVLVRVVLADGTVGYGEAAPLPAYNGETQETTLHALEQLRPLIEGADARKWRGLARTLTEPYRSAGSARAAVEVAILDAMAKHHQISFSTLFGASETSLTTDVTITTGTVENAGEAAARWSREGFDTLKIKLGASDVETDIARIAAVKEAAPASRITLDANGAFRANEAIDLVGRVRARRIEIALFEQPTPKGDWNGLFEVAQHVPIAADESVVTAADALIASRLGFPHAVNIKLMKAGVLEALGIAAVVRAAGMRLMIGGNVETILAMTVSAFFAAGHGDFAFVDLDTPMFLATNPFRGGFQMNGASISLADVASGGHGVEPREPLGTSALER